MIILFIILLLLILYLFLIAPSFQNHPDKEVLKGMKIAHRGYHDIVGNCPENSMNAFSEAMKKGYTIENDIHITRDNEVVVFHDDTLKRMCGEDKVIEDLTLEEIKKYTLKDSDQKIPTLKECLDLVDGKVPLLIEFKAFNMDHTKRLCEEADKILSEYKGKYFIQSFYPFVLNWYKKNRPDILRGQLAENKKGKPIKERLLGFLIFNFLSRPHFLSYSYESPRFLPRKLCSMLGALPVCWTLPDKKAFEESKKHFKAFIFENFEA